LGGKTRIITTTVLEKETNENKYFLYAGIEVDEIIFVYVHQLP